MKVAVLGLGEAGSLLAADLALFGDDVAGYDPAITSAIEGVNLCESAKAAVTGRDLVLAVTHASHAAPLLDSVVDDLPPGAIYGDLSTGSPGLKESLAAVAAGRSVRFIDVALMAPVPGRGLGVPALAAGAGAFEFAQMINDRGGRVTVVGETAGAAAARKLLRSVVMKGLAALLIESTEAAERYGVGDWFWNHLVEQFGAIDEAFLRRLRLATSTHAGRRVEEMEAARELLMELGVPTTMTEGTIAWLQRLTEQGEVGWETSDSGDTIGG
jgi:3-hydroxyisobutyrate dehydrogenase-like beta-hydroxyacid dehydrogenase